MPAFDDTALTAALGGRPEVVDRLQRVAWIGEVATALARGILPTEDAGRFVAKALLAWLEHGGDLEGEYLKVHQRGSHHTPSRLWEMLISDEDSHRNDV